jgi:uncharacterized membrane protein YjjB (DUF3815 family)
MNVTVTIFDIIIAAIGGACFGIIFRIPPRYFLHATILAMIARLGASIIGSSTHIGFATFVSTFAVGAVSHVFARITGKPAQAFLIPGVMFLVPGTSLYKAFSGALSADYQSAMALLVQAIIVTASISFALLLANWVIPSKRTL